jgi:hypothetical protein
VLKRVNYIQPTAGGWVNFIQLAGAPAVFSPEHRSKEAADNNGTDFARSFFNSTRRGGIGPLPA